MSKLLTHLYVILAYATFFPMAQSINQCEFSFSYSSTGFGSFPFYKAAYDSSTDKFYLLVGIETTLVQHDATGTVLNTLKADSQVFFGLFVPLPGGKAWVHGLAGSGTGLLLVVNDDFTVAYMMEMGEAIWDAASDGNGYTYLFVTVDSYIYIVKI